MTDDVAVPRLSGVLDDRTPLTASRIDVAARVGWLLRTHRSVVGLSLREMSVALRDHDVTLSAATLSRIESEGHRSEAAPPPHRLRGSQPSGRGALNSNLSLDSGAGNPLRGRF